MTVEVATGDMPADEARKRIARVRTHVLAAWDDLIALWARRAWVALGHPSWDALCDAELGGARIALPRQDRREVVGRMRGAGMSTRAIGNAIGASEGTIRNDLASGAQSCAPDVPAAVPAGTPDADATPEAPGPGDGSPSARPARDTTTGLDGKHYPRPAPDPVADAKAKARRSPRIVAAKAIERFRDGRRTVVACGGVDAILADTDDFDDIAPLWLAEIDDDLAVLNEWRAALLRRRIRSVK